MIRKIPSRIGLTFVMMFIFLGFAQSSAADFNVALHKDYFSSEPNQYGWDGLTDGRIVENADQEMENNGYTFATGASTNFPKWVIIDLEGTYEIDTIRLYKEFGPSCIVNGKQYCAWDDPNSCSTEMNNTRRVRVQSRESGSSWVNWGNYVFSRSPGELHVWTRPSKIPASQIRITFQNTYDQWRQSSPCQCTNCGDYVFLREAEVWGNYASCTLPWGGTISHGDSVTAYENSSVPCGESCLSEIRMCENGILGGSYTYQNCSVDPCAGAPTLSFVANPSSISSGSYSTLEWTPQNADSCTAGGGWSGSKASADGSYSEPVSPSVNTTYNLTCSNAVGSVSKQADILVSGAGGGGAGGGSAPCIPDCSCKYSICEGDTCSDGCGGSCPGTRDCSWVEVKP